MATDGVSPNEREALFGDSGGPLFKRRWFRVVAIIAAVVIVGIVILIAAAPSIAGAMAPGFIQNAAKGNIAGSVKVQSVTLSWGGPIAATGVEVIDPAGKTVAIVSAKSTLGLWSLVSGVRNVGVLTVSGKADLIADADGTTNLQRALASPNAPPSKSGAPAGSATVNRSAPPPGAVGKLEIAGIDVTYKALDAKGSVTQQASITGLKGSIDIINDKTVGASVAIELGAAVGGAVGSAAPSIGALKVSLSANELDARSPQLLTSKSKFDLSIDAAQLPVALLDAIAMQKGLLVEALGDSLTINVKGSGTLAAAKLNAKIASPNINADLALDAADRLKGVAPAPGSLSIKSTAFLARVPAVADALAKAGMKIDGWPSVNAQIVTFDLPRPPVNAAGSPAPLSELDMRSAKIEAKLRMEGVKGTLTSADSTRTFDLAPLDAALVADFGGDVAIKAATSATIDSKPAGDVHIDLAASGLTDDKGRLALLQPAASPGQGMAMPKSLSGTIAVNKLATQLAQPLVIATKLPIELAADVGPTLDLVATFKTVPGAAGAAIPPSDLDLTIASQFINLSAPFHVDATTITSRSDVRLTVASAAPLASRILASSGGANPPVRLSGTAPLAVSISGISIPVPKVGTPFNLADATAAVHLELKDLGIDTGPESAKLTTPLHIDDLKTDLTLAKGKAPTVKLDSQLTHENKPFTAQADLTIASLFEALNSKAPNAMLPGIGMPRVQGELAVKSLPTSVAKLLPSSPPTAAAPGANASTAPAAATDTGSIMGELIAGLAGQTVDLTLDFNKDGVVKDITVDPTRQQVILKVVGQRTAAGFAVDVNPSEARLLVASGNATVSPDLFKALVKMADSGPADYSRVEVSGPAAITFHADKATIPLDTTGGTIKPNFAKASAFALSFDIRDPLIVRGLPVGGHTITGGVKGFTGTATIPLSMLAATPAKGSADRLQANIKGQVIADERTSVANVDLVVNSAADASTINAQANLSSVDVNALDRVLGQAGAASSALGATADIKLSVTREAGKPILVRADAASPLLKATDLRLAMSDTDIRLGEPGKPTSIQWTITPEFARLYLLKPPPPDREGREFPTVSQNAPVTLDVRSLVLSRPTGEGDAKTGLFKPGVFAIDAQASIPTLALNWKGDVAADLPPPPAATPTPAAPPAAPAAPAKSAPPPKDNKKSNPLGDLIGGITGDKNKNNNTNNTSNNSSPAQPSRSAPKGPTIVAQSAVFSNVSAVIKSESDGAIGFDISAASVTGPNIPAGSAASAKGKIGSYNDAKGNFLADSAKLSADAGLKNFSLALLDILAGEQGSAVQLLGPIVQSDLQARGLNKQTGTLTFSASTDRANAKLNAQVKDFVADSGNSLNAELKQVYYRTGGSFLGFMPLVSEFQKTTLDKPAIVTAQALSFPLNGDMTKLNGVITVDPGTAHFELFDALSTILNLVDQRSKGAVGERLKPFTVTIKDGIATYSNFELPIGTTTIRTSGTINLVNKTCDLISYVPIEYVAKKFIPGLGDAIGGILSKVEAGKLIGIRIRGDLNKPTVTPTAL